MKRKLSLLLAVVLAMTMVMGIGVTAMADPVPSVTIETVSSFDFANPATLPVLSVAGDGIEFFPMYLVYLDSSKTPLFMCAPMDDNKFYDFEGDEIDNPEFDDVEYAIYYGQCTGHGEDAFNDTNIIGLTSSLPLEKVTLMWLIPPSSLSGEISDYTGYYKDGARLHIQIAYSKNGSSNPGSDPSAKNSSSPAHVHSFQWQTITEPTKDADGLEGEVCSCGATRNTQPLSAYGYALNQYATPMINAAKSGQTITFEFGEWNSFPKSFMAKLVDKSAQNVTFVFHYKWNHVKQEITIPAGTPIDLNFDWYGPAKMAELYGAN